MERETQDLTLAAETLLGGNLPLQSGLYVLEGSSADRHADGEWRTVPKFDVLTAIPMINMIISADRGAGEFITEMGAGIGASTVLPHDIPVAARAAAAGSFTVLPDGVQLNSPGLGPAFAQPIRVQDRLKYFLDLTRTVVLFIGLADGSVSCALTIANGAATPTFATKAGALASKGFDAMVRTGTWSAVQMAYAPLAGRGAERHAHYEVYESRPTRTFLPRVSYVGSCILCGDPAGSKEHCVPDWLAARELVEPVTCPLLCEPCNNRFGTGLEERVCRAWPGDGANPLLPTRDFARWAAKTAFTCSVAAGLRVPFGWTSEVGQDRIPPGFVVHAGRCRTSEPGYSFIVTTFDNSGSPDGEFLFSFQSSDVYFVVAKSADDLSSCLGIPRRYPGPGAAGRAVSTIREAHEAAIEMITGARTMFSEGTGKRLKATRPERS